MAEAELVRGRLSSVGLEEGADPGEAAPQGLSALMSASRLTYPGDGFLPVEDIPLETEDVAGGEVRDGRADSSEGVASSTSDVSPPDDGRDVLLARLNALEAELATLRTPVPQPVPAQPVTAPSPMDYAPLVEKATGRFAQLFSDVEGFDPADPNYNTQRAERFARSIIESVTEDILGDPRVMQARVDPVVTARAREVVQQDRMARTEQDALSLAIQRAVAVSREAGYDVHPPGTPQHLASSESRLFWGAATQVDQTIPIEDQITQTLALLPAKTVPARTSTSSSGTAPVRQPMARQGMGRTSSGPQTTPAEEDYRPKTLKDMMGETRNLRVVA